MSEINQELFCKFCGMNLKNTRDMDNHLKTKKHDINQAKGEIYCKPIEQFQPIVCDFCGVCLKTKRDLENHNKTKKHIKNQLNIDSNKCMFCDYKSNAGNLKRHNQTVHNEEYDNVDKPLESDIYPVYIIKLLMTLKTSEVNKGLQISGYNSRIKRLLNRLFKEDELNVIEARMAHKNAIDDMKKIQKKIKDIMDKYPDIENAIKLSLEKLKEEERKKDEEEIMTELREIEFELIESSKQEEKRLDRLAQINSIRDKINDNYDKYIDSHGDKYYTDAIEELEKQLSSIN